MSTTDDETGSVNQAHHPELELSRMREQLNAMAKEVEAKSTQLQDSLEYQAATAEVLKVISSSPADAQAVFDTIVRSAVLLCGAMYGSVVRFDGELLHLVAGYNYTPEVDRALRHAFPMQPNPRMMSGRVILSRDVVQVEDVLGDPDYPKDIWQAGGFRSMLAAPMLRNGHPIGAIVVNRGEPGPFSPTQIQLLRTFADQAVIALENARLFEQVELKTKELTALNSTLEARVQAQVNELDRMSRLRRFLPRELAELIVSSGNESLLDSHRREITVVFCDLRGFTAFSEVAEPEEVMVVLNEYHSVAGPLIEHHGGTIERFLGDGLMVLFNDPLPCDDPAQRAVRLSVELRNAMDETCSKWESQGYQLGFGVGVAHGFATLGKIGFEGRMEYTAIGTVVNQAARLCGEAQAGEILITQRVANITKDLIQVEPIGELSLKGFRQPVSGFRLLDAKV